MKISSPPLLATLALFVCVGAAAPPAEADSPEKPARETAQETEYSTAAASTTTTKSSGSKPSTTSTAKQKPYADVVKDAETIDGLIKLHLKDAKLYAEIGNGNLNKDFIVAISIARGIGRSPLYGGMTWGFGDDWLWQFRKVDDRIQIVRRNVRFRAAKGSREEKAVRLAYTDSVLFSLPILSTSPSGSSVIDLTSVFMSDLPQVSTVLRGFAFSKDKSTWASVKGFRNNVELQVAATYASSGTTQLETVADSRGVTINIHYSISRLPETGYKPRKADDRVGYFLTVLRDYSKTGGYDRFVRYVNRWDLQKADATVTVSPPKTPIIFWLEKTVPFKYRKAVRDGILEWNLAFEQAGFSNAIEVRQQPDDAEWDPEDINYNTFRWITSSAGFAMGPSRVNPTTGQILDADIIFDADFIQFWDEHHKVLAPHEESRLPHDWPPTASLSPHWQHRAGGRCECSHGMSCQLAFGALMLAEDGAAASSQELNEMVMQGVKEVVSHEVGHTLGLRHNFKASAFLSLKEINDPAKTQYTGLAASVMDYLPVNISPKGQRQGDYFSKTIGPYDYWAIEYGYKPVESDKDLEKIASRCAEPAFQYATDEDSGAAAPDPLVNRFDLGDDPIAYARQRVELIQQALPDLPNRITPEGHSYHQARRAFNILLSEHGEAMHFVARYIGGIYVHRDHRGDPNARPPLVVVPREKQLEAMKLLEEQVFGPDSYQFPPELYSYMAPSNWIHWGNARTSRIDYPIHEVMLVWADRVLGQLLASVTLSRLRDSELGVSPDTQVFTTAELIERLSAAIFSELDTLKDGKFTNRKPAIASLRRSLQRRYLERLANLAMGNSAAPEDCQAMAFTELEALEARIKQVLAGKAQLDSYTRAHLSETASRIRKVLDARLQLRTP